MTRLPSMTGGGRWIGLVLVTMLGLAQAAALGVTAFATRGIFSEMHRDAIPVPGVFMLLIAAIIAGFALRVAIRMISENIGGRFVAELRKRFYAHVAGMSRSDLSRRRRGMLSLRFVGDLQAARNWAGSGIAVGIAAVITIIGATVVLALLRPVFALAVIGPILFLVPLAIVLGFLLDRRHRDLRRKRGSLAASMAERLELAPGLDLANRTTRELDRLEQAGRELTSQSVSRRGLFECLRGLPHVATGLAGVVILWIVSHRALPASEAAASLAVISIMSLPLGDLVRVWDRYCAWRITRMSFRRLFAGQSRPREIKPQGRAVPVRIEGAVKGAGPLSINIEPGSLVVICGPAASGKSSLAKALAAEDQPEAGNITYQDEGGDLPAIAYVGEEPLILKGSLRRALSLGIDPRPDPRQIRKVARLFGLGSLLERVGSTKAQVLERGENLSMTEQLAVGLVRAGLMRPDLIVIDHPVLASSSQAGEMILGLKGIVDATIVVVSAPELLPGADQIIRLGDACSVQS